MKTIIKKIITIIIIAIIISIGITNTKAVGNADYSYVEVTADTSKYETDGTIEITISLKNVNQNISYFDGYIYYDTDLFEEVQSSDFSNKYSDEELSYFSYSESKNKIVMEFDDDTKVDEVCKLTLRAKENAQIGTTYFKVDNSSYYSYATDQTTYLDNITKTVTINQEPDPGPVRGLYLSSEKYKIGDYDIKNYNEGDKYISRVEDNTTLEDYINNLKTNGTVKVIKQDGNELGEGELVGTGMTLQVTKDEEKIELQIAVMGDLDGNGRVTATDLATINQAVLELVELENEYALAGDFDENNRFTATDLAQLNQLLLESI